MPVDAAADPRRDDSNEIPCEPRAVLQTVCQQCHTFPPARGAPFPLVTLTDVLTQRPGGVARDLMIAQLQAHRMPLAPVTIEDSQRAALLAWLQGGATAVSPQACIEPADAGSDADADGSDVDDAGTDAFEAGSDPDASQDAATD